MAIQSNQNTEQVQELYFPFKGASEAMAYKNQAPQTSPFVLNCRIKDVSEQRARGGQRPGLKKVFTDPVGPNRPVLKIVNVVNTYITPQV